MRSSERGVKTSINSEIHASLRRLEDADTINNMVQAEAMNLIIGQTNEANQNLQSQIDGLSSEVYQLHSYISPHILHEDLQYFQTLYVGNLQVASGGVINGQVTFNGKVITNAVLEAYGVIEANNDINSYTKINCEGSFVYDNETFGAHTLSIEGTALTGSIFSTQDMSFSLAGLASGSWAGNTYAVKTNTNQIVLDSTTLTPEAHYSYNSNTHEYQIWATVKDENGTNRLTSGAVYSGTDAYEDGEDAGSAPPNSATFEWFETVNDEPHFRRTGGDYFGRTSRTVYWY